MEANTRCVKDGINRTSGQNDRPSKIDLPRARFPAKILVIRVHVTPVRLHMMQTGAGRGVSHTAGYFQPSRAALQPSHRRK